MQRYAVFNPDRTHRFLLTRRWDTGTIVNFLMLNPSTADEHGDDPTITKCIGLAKEWGFAGLYVTNLFSLRTPYSKFLVKTDHPNHPDNDHYVHLASHFSDTIVAAWGSSVPHKFISERMNLVIRGLLASGLTMMCIGINTDGNPRHPLMVPLSSQYGIYQQPQGGNY